MDKPEARRQLRSSIGGALQPFSKYGLDVFMPGAMTAVIQAAEQFHKDMLESSPVTLSLPEVITYQSHTLEDIDDMISKEG